MLLSLRASLALGLTLVAATVSVATTGEPTLTLVWADEFAVDGPPHPGRWRLEEGFVRNEELQWYSAGNAVCRDGLLAIEARRERVANPLHDAASSDWRRRRSHAEYTSASLTTAGRGAWQYGRWDVRARIDARPGLWPAIWTLGAGGEWPSNGEIDVMEAYRGQLLANVAWGTSDRWVPRWATSRVPLAELGPAWTSEFHVWRLDWDPHAIRLSVDGRLLNSVPLTETRNPDGSNPFRQPHVLLLNLAVGGANGGDPSATTLPARFEIDYVRIYASR